MPNPTARAVLNQLPLPNTNNGLLYNNYRFNGPSRDDTTQWDTRLDWNINAKDTAYSSFSYWNEPSYQPPLFGILAGGGNISANLSGSFMFSETHIFTPTLTNEFRVGFNDIRSHRTQFNAANAGFAASLGFGGIPAGYMNGGIPQMWFSGGAYNIANFGSGGYTPGTEKENVYQIIDNVTKILGNHDLKAGVNFLSIRFSSQEPPASRGNYYYTGEYTSNLNAPNTGFSAADFLLDSQNSAVLSSEFVSGQARWYDGAYVQDDWRVTKQITLNAGLRWEYFQPYQDVGGYQASYSMNGPFSLNTATGVGSGSAVLQFPAEIESYVQTIFAQTSNAFPNLLAKDNIALQFNNDPHLIAAQKDNFGPRLGIAYSPDNKILHPRGLWFFLRRIGECRLHAESGAELSLPVRLKLPVRQLFRNLLPHRRDHHWQRLLRHPGPRADWQCDRPVPARHPSLA